LGSSGAWMLTDQSATQDARIADVLSVRAETTEKWTRRTSTGVVRLDSDVLIRVLHFLRHAESSERHRELHQTHGWKSKWRQQQTTEQTRHPH